MFNKAHYLFVILSIGAGLLSLLGSVGIFVSLIVQRRVERLQDILEELIDLSKFEDQNLSSRIYQLIQKYQMHYLLPDQPTKLIQNYINMTIILVVIIWSVLHFLIFEPPPRLIVLTLLLPLAGGIILLYFFRRLLQNAINPLDNPLLNGIIPPPTRLRSVSFLSKYVNVSVKALMKQARLVLLINQPKEGTHGEVILKEELSFDDFFYYIYVAQKGSRLRFVGFGKIAFDFPSDPITKKPAPIKHNVNVPLGECDWESLTEGELDAKMLLFPYGEKYPIQYNFILERQSDCFISSDKPEISINHSIMYMFVSKKIEIVENKDDFPHLDLAKEFFESGKSRFYYFFSEAPEIKHEVRQCTRKAFVD